MMASQSIARQLTADPAGVADPIALPDGMTRGQASRRLDEMAMLVDQAANAESIADARRLLTPLFGIEIDSIRERDRDRVSSHPLNAALQRRDYAAAAAALGATELIKPARSHGDQ
jgi:hypothetical protein